MQPVTTKKRSKRKPSSAKSRAATTKSTDATGAKRPARTVTLGLGSNLGDRRAHLSAAVERIGRLASIRKVSSLYESDPVGFADQPPFWNMVLEIRWRGSAPSLFSALKRIERAGGRAPTFRNGPRVIDCDILDFGGRVASRNGLILPHAHLPERRFALAPLSEIAPRWRHPILGLTALAMMRRLPKRPGARRLKTTLKTERGARSESGS
jgi:2-amino-4-hydroxy-6-hydroxymethyldihydropteridine diphosphokinase